MIELGEVESNQLFLDVDQIQAFFKVELHDMKLEETQDIALWTIQINTLTSIRS